VEYAIRSPIRLLACLFALWLASLSVAATAPASTAPGLPIHDGVGGEFSAASSLGRQVSLAEYRGKVVLLFFGYTSCQDVCPVTLSHLASLVKRLGPAADAVQVLLVTIDPAVDSAEHLAEYLARFDSRFVGLTGGPADIDRIAALFMAKHDRSHPVSVPTTHHVSKTFTDRIEIYSHSQQVYLLDTAGRTRGMYFSGSPLEEMESAVRSLLDEAGKEVPEARVSKDDDSGEGPCPEASPGCKHDHHQDHHQHHQGSEGSEQ
jgi:protein SCO1